MSGADVDDLGERLRHGVGGRPADRLTAHAVHGPHGAVTVLGGLHDGRGDLLAVVVEGGVHPGHVPRRGVHGAEGDRGPLGEVLVRYAHGERGLLHGGRGDVDDHLREDGVDRLVHRPLDGRAVVADVVLVLRGERGVAADDGALAGAVVDRVQADEVAVLGGRLVLQRGGEHQRLEGGGRLVVLPGGVVVPVLGGSDTAVQRDDLAGLRVHGRGAGLDGRVDLVVLPVELVLQLPVDRLLELLLPLLVDVEGDRPATGVQHLLGDALALHLVVRGLDEVTGLPFHARGGLGRLGHGERHPVPLGLVEPALADHVVQRVGPALLDELLAGGCRVRPVVLAGCLEQSGEVGALGGVEILGVDAVVGLCRRLDTARAASVVHGVEVTGEDVVLLRALVDLEGDHQLLELAGDRLVLREVVVLHVLLGDRGSALLALARERVEQAAHGALQVDALVTVEGLVLGGDERVLDALGYDAEVDYLPVDLGVAPGQERAVAVLVDVALLLGLGVGLRNVDVQVERGQGPHAEQAETEERAHDLPPGEEPAYAAALGPAGFAPLGSPRIRSTHRCGAPVLLLVPLRSDLPANTESLDKWQAIRPFPDVRISTHPRRNRLPRGARGCETR